jgi:WD40 repeat protein
VRVLSAHKKPINCAAFAPDGTQLAEVADGRVRVWNVAAGAVAHTFDVKHWSSKRMRLCFSPDGTRLAVTCAGVALIDLADGTQRRIRSDFSLYDVACSPGGQVLGHSYTYHRWDAATGKALPRLKLSRESDRLLIGMCTASAFNRDGTRLAVARNVSHRTKYSWRRGQQILVCDSATGAVVAPLELAHPEATRIAFSPGGAHLAAACGRALRVWALSTGELVAEHRPDKRSFSALAFSPDGRYLATVSKDQTTRFWEVGAWDVTKTFEWNAGRLIDVAFAPDGTIAAVSSDKGQIVLFDVD